MPIFAPKNLAEYETSSPVLAALLGLSARRIQQLAAEGVLPRGKNGFKLAASLKAYVQWLKDAHERTPASDAKEAVLLERARSLRLQNDEREHRLVDTEECIAVLDEIVGTYRTELDGLPARLTRDLEDREQIAKIVDALSHRVCDKFEQRTAELRANGSIAVPLEVDDEV
jgi:phage terminase Nu1 subunit (DNA packaging protein)